MAEGNNRFVITYFDAEGMVRDTWGFAKQKSALEIFSADAEFRNGRMTKVDSIELRDTKKNLVLATAQRT